MSIDETYIQTATEQALETLLWSESDDNGEPLDALYSAYDITGDEVDIFADQLRDFILSNQDDLLDITATSCGHDFVLTRNGHGVGFWDRGYGDRGDRLTAACKPYGECGLYVGDDDGLYMYV